MTDATVLGTAHQLAGRALDWLHRAHESGLGGLGPDAGPDLSDPDDAYKPLGEGALAAALVLREPVAGPADRARARALLDFGWAELSGGDLLYERQFRHPLLTDPLETYAHFHRAGYHHPALVGLLAELARLRAAQAVEHLPNRRLAVANARSVLGLRPEPDWPALAAATWLGARPEPWALDWQTAYDLTHTVFHLTDWGAQPDRLPAPLRDYLRCWLPAWAEVWQETGQWDLLGELLVVDACLPAPVCDARPWLALAAAQHPDGLLPRDTEPVPADDPDRAFKDHQHTAVVGLLAGTLTLAQALR
ncbi:hypothetical protein CFP65_4617 [Kitasatospora sp. MMS16-BH015]|uniref:DUF6895 family protein n=1 Tax=Kitasatospora sp. MMS16-BH015 TaxID=2018025 RepID=UPI000CA38572|nr:hypothetical protein [Kitasatospora sp. MMS16-BH015]AUG79353.1 hypothetical protein CFP65_4617 [Kitasatospora sp. MMS16-BH015]